MVAWMAGEENDLVNCSNAQLGILELATKLVECSSAILKLQLGPL